MVGLPIIDLLTETGFIQGRKEAGRALSENSVMVNNEKVTQDFILSSENLIAGKYVLLQRGKKNKFLAINQ
jgi:tyrosyl-tRNA synthetase